MEVFHVDLDVFEKQDVSFPVVLGRVLAVEVIDESGQVPAQGHSGQPPLGRPGQPEHAVVGDRLVKQQGSHFFEISRTQAQGWEVDRRDAGVVMDVVEQEGEIGKAHENGFPLFNHLVVLLVYLEQDILGPGAAGHGHNQVGLPDGFLEDLSPGLKRGGDVIYELVAGEKMGTLLDVNRAQDFLEAADGLVDQALLAYG